MRKFFGLIIAATLACGVQSIRTPPGYDHDVAPGVAQDLAPLTSAVGATGPITWTIDPGGGTITQQGLYTAPNCATLIAALPNGTDLAAAGKITGTDRVTATWQGGSVLILITVAEEVLGVEVVPVSVSVPIGGTQQFHAIVHFTCHDQSV